MPECDPETSTTGGLGTIGVLRQKEKVWVPMMVENTFKSHGERSELDMGWFNTFKCMERRVSRTVSASCRETDDTLRDQAREFYLLGSRNADVSSTETLYVYSLFCSYYKGR